MEQESISPSESIAKVSFHKGLGSNSLKRLATAPHPNISFKHEDKVEKQKKEIYLKWP